MSNIDKDFLLNKSKTFCIFPFIHLHTLPNGYALPCCVAQAPQEKYGNTTHQSIKAVINGEQMKTLRYNMLNEIKSETCMGCYRHEEEGIQSSRTAVLRDYRHFFDTDVSENVDPNTGELKEFKMRYFDIRFSNICNFKCRTCHPSYSSQWEQELKTHFPNKYIPVENNKSPRLIEEIKTHIPYMESAYFAGGEPLITEEHYILLEEMIRTRKGEISLIYNTNLSNLKFKDKDILELWKNFKTVDISASIDHCNEKAEYIRHGTDWNTQMKNIKVVSGLPYVRFSINSVVSVFNYVTIYQLYKILIKEKILTPSSRTYSLYNMINPEYFSSTVLPKSIKDMGTKKLNELMSFMARHNFSDDQLRQIQSTITWTNSRHDWIKHKEKFRQRVREIDQIRNENFSKVFPELHTMMADK